jgi:lysophospholipase L1-like esterase
VSPIEKFVALVVGVVGVAWLLRSGANDYIRSKRNDGSSPNSNGGLQYADVSSVAPLPQLDLMRSGDWMRLHHRLVDEGKEIRLTKTTKVIFVGDSITESWRGSQWGKPTERAKGVDTLFASEFGERFGARAWAIAGDQTQHVLWRIEREFSFVFEPLPSIDAETNVVAMHNDSAICDFGVQVIVLHIGTNNVARSGHSAEEVIDGIVAIIARLHTFLPHARFLLLSILPRADERHGSVAALNAVIHEVNTRFENTSWPFASDVASSGTTANAGGGVVDAPSVEVLNCNSVFIDTSLPSSDKTTGYTQLRKNLMPDDLHPGYEGHKLWSTCIHTALDAMVALS